MSIIDFFSKKDPSYDAASEFFVMPELGIQEGKQDGYSLAIDTGYEDLVRTVKHLNFEGDEISIKTETSYVDFKEVFEALNIADKPKTVPDTSSLLSKKPVATSQPTAVDAKSKNKKADAPKKSLENELVPGSILSSDLPEKIALKQKEVIVDGVYYKAIKVLSTLEIQDNGDKSDIDIATSYYLVPVSYINGQYKELSATQCAHIVETSWADAYIEAMNGESAVPERKVAATTTSTSSSAIKNPALKAPLIVAASMAFAFASLYGYNQYEQNTNPLSLAASNGNVGTYMNAKGSNTSEYTQRQLDATKAALSSMGIDVSAEADIGCLIE
ncbi:MAG: hypothetical protein VYA60_04395 [Pseudomonadota bacterium]|nr:hypothetical protein [Pseudomonadota bacterium]